MLIDVDHRFEKFRSTRKKLIRKAFSIDKLGEILDAAHRLIRKPTKTPKI